jgi:hypothetical protein
MDNTVKNSVCTPNKSKDVKKEKLEGAKNVKTFENYWNEDEVEKGVVEGLLIEVCVYIQIRIDKMQFFIIIFKTNFCFCRVFSELILKITGKLILHLQ